MNPLSYTKLLKPLFIINLFLLILNDHYLKHNFPSVLSGKLSDFCGLFVFAVLLAIIFRSLIKSRSSLVIFHLIVASLFIIWKLAPVELFLDKLYSLTGLYFSRVKDTSDLIALVMLIPSYLFLTKQPQVKLTYSLIRKIALSSVILISGWSIMATSKALHMEYFCCEDIRGNVYDTSNDIVDINDILYLNLYLHQDAPRPDCIFEADVDGSKDKQFITVDDLNYLISYVFEFGPEPAGCD